MIGKNLRKTIEQLLSIFCMLKKKKYMLLMFPNITRERQVIFFNDYKQTRMALFCSEKLAALLRGITSKHHGQFYCLHYFHSFPARNKRESHKKSMWK